MWALMVREAGASSGIAYGTSACVECFASYGLDANTAAALAVVLAVVVRVVSPLLVDWWRTKRTAAKEHQQERASQAVRLDHEEPREGAAR